ncbi:MAG: helix-turn-helix transcriptional regulator [Phascolarctobacterium sp.]|nr:helix-turn-helix transcriptional regulator [Phascolarctobacterium sp.]
MAKYNNEELLENLGLEIKLYRYSKGITQKEFADMLGVTSQYLSKIEKGHELINMPTFINLVIITKKYGLYMLLHSLYGDNFLEIEEDKISKLAADIVGTVFKNLKGNELESLPRYYGNDSMRVGKKRKNRKSLE